MTKPAHRHRARRLALQAFYQWQISQTALTDIEAQFHTDNDMDRVDVDYFHELLHQIPAHLSELDEQFSPHMNRSLAEVDPIELAVLRIGCYELQHRLDIPYKVVIDEALRLTKAFGTVEGYKFVNAILDKVAKQTRQLEIKNV